MELVEVRRLTGPNLLLDVPGAVLDARCDDPATVLAALRARLAPYLAALRTADPVWQQVGVEDAARTWDAGEGPMGCTWLVPAPVDLLYATCAVLEAVWDDVAGGVGTDAAVEDEALATVIREAADERDEALLALLDAAAEHGVAGVWDDDEVSVGLGTGSRSWTRSAAPAPEDVPWGDVHDVPVALVTGTNGKSTTVRMLAAILSSAGRVPGHSSTDGIVVDGELVETGDWSGPGGGRTVARDRRVGTMVLEAARGGLLRRGLPLDRADVAVVTNVAADHLHEYGIETVDDLADAKLVVARGVRHGGVLVVNGEDERLVARTPASGTTWRFGLDPEAPALAATLAAGGTVATVVDDQLVLRGPEGGQVLAAVGDVPATHGGAARHNVANALAAALAAHALGVAPADVARGLRGFATDAASNPGRANRFELDGVTVVVDFAHNVHGVRAMAELAAALPGERRVVLFSQAGDRDDVALDDLAGAVHATAPDGYVLADIDKYLRGREPMEVPTVLADALRRRGVADDAITLVPDAVVGTRRLLDEARPGDVLLLLTLQDRDGVVELLRERGAVEV